MNVDFGLLNQQNFGQQMREGQQSAIDLQNRKQQGELLNLEIQKTISEKEAVEFNQLSKARKQRYVDAMSTAAALVNAGDIAGGREVLVQQILDVEKDGGDPISGRRGLAIFDANPQMFAAGVEPMVVSRGGTMQKEKDKQVDFKTGLIYDPNTDTMTLNPTISDRVDNIARKAENSKNGFTAKDITALNTAFKPVITQVNESKAIAEQLNSLMKKGSAVAKLGAIFGIMKAFDPRSVVREGEQEAVRMTGGAIDWLVAKVQGLSGEGAMTDTVLKDIVSTAMTIANTQISEGTRNLNGQLATYGDLVPEDLRQKQLARLPALYTEQQMTFDSNTAPAEEEDDEIRNLREENAKLEAELNN